jgi:hypothetical protein
LGGRGHNADPGVHPVGLVSRLRQVVGVDTAVATYSRFPLVIAFVAVVSFLALAPACRSLAIPVTALMLNSLDCRCPTAP